MGLETAEFISDLVITNPTGSDPKSQGDNHLRNIKKAVTQSFPNSDRAFYLPASEAISSAESVVAADENLLYVVTTTSAAVTITLPDTSTISAGWQVHFVKVNTGANPIFIAPNSGTLLSGSQSLSKTRRSVPGVVCTAYWTGNEWFVTRAVGVPVGAIVPFDGATLPAGYEWPNGQTLASASTNYPDYNGYKGSGVTQDLRQRFIGFHNLGGSDAGRLTGQTGGVDGDTLGNTGGTETHTLSATEMPAHTHGVSITSGAGGTHTHTVGRRNGTGGGFDASNLQTAAGTPGTIGTHTSSSDGNHTHLVSGNTGSAGSGGAHNNIPPVIILGALLVVE